MAGEKTVEFRRRFQTQVSTDVEAYIYATSPVRAMVGVAEISSVWRLSLESLWCRYAKPACVGRMDFDTYFRDLDWGFALELANVQCFANPISLHELGERVGFTPPQSYLYAKADLRALLEQVPREAPNQLTCF